jgi:hypothetical protein
VSAAVVRLPVAPACGARPDSPVFTAESGGQVAWLMPAALMLLVAVLAYTQAGRPHRSGRAVLWGGWLVATAGTFSFMAGTTRTTRWFWRRRSEPVGSGAAVAPAWCPCGARRHVGVTPLSYVLLGRSTTFVGLARWCWCSAWWPWWR